MEHNERTKLIIDIPKDYYKAICTRAKYLGEDSTILKPEERAIAKGSYFQTKYEDIKTDISQNVEIIDGKGYIKVYDLYQILHQHFVFKEEQGENNGRIWPW